MDKVIQFKGTVYENGYGLIAKNVMTDLEISIGAKALYSYICAYAGSDGGAFPARERITKELGISKDTFTKYKKELVKNGYLIIEQKRVSGKFKSNIYNIAPCPKKEDTEEKREKSTPPCPKSSDTTEPCPKSSDTRNLDTTSINSLTSINTYTSINNKNILSGSEDQGDKGEELQEKIPYEKIVEHLNSAAGKSFKATTKKTRELIKTRFKDGFKEEDFMRVINNKCTTWKGTEFENYLRPETLFGNKFEGYLNENPRVKKEQKSYGKKESSFCDFDQRKYDGSDGGMTMTELEKKLLGWKKDE